MRNGYRTSLVVAALFVVFLNLAQPPPAAANWPQFGRAVVTSEDAQLHAAIAGDGAGGAIVTWQDLRFRRVNVFARHVLASGELDEAWPFEGQSLLGDTLAMAGAAGGQTSPLIASDGTGGAIVAWQDLRTEANDTDLFAQHILGSGNLDRAWPANGTAVVAIPGVQNTHAMVPDGAGGVIVTWVDARAGAGVTDIFAQHVLSSGIVDPRWPVNGLAVCTAAGSQGFPAIVGDAAGGAIITWEDPRPDANGFDVFAQHVLVSGVVDPAWPANGRAVCAAARDQGRPTIATDGAHGAIVSWTDTRVLNTAHIFAQHVLASGVVDPVWPVDGRAISAAGEIETRPIAVPDGAGGAIVNWQAFTVTITQYAQHVTTAGVVDPAWPAGGRALSSSVRQQTFGDIASDGAGGALVSWQENADIFAQHVLSSGTLNPAYPETGRLLIGLSSGQGDAAIVATGAGGAIVAWTDLRNGKDADIYTMQVLEAATVGVPDPEQAGISFARPSPNPARGSLTLRFALPRDARVRLAIYDVTGRQVRELASGAEPAGGHAITWDLHDAGGRGVGAGLYFARLEVDGHALTQRLATLE